jgi:hypothetical protein
LLARSHGQDRVVFHPFAIASQGGEATMMVRGEYTEMFGEETEGEKVTVQTISPAMFCERVPGPVDLLVCNAQGCEYELMNYLIESGEVARFKRLWIQFHTQRRLDYNAQFSAITYAMDKTHLVASNQGMAWMRWDRKSG